MVNIVVIGTLDTKLEELLYLRTRIIDAACGQPCSVILVDVGRSVTRHEHITVGHDILIQKYRPQESGLKQDVGSLERGDVIKYMVACASNWLRDTYEAGVKDPSKAIHGIIGAGGTGNTSLVSKVMQDVLPLGFPKFIVSTAASGETGPIVGESDITLMYSVVDIAGVNSILQRVLNNAAGAIVGMASAYERGTAQSSGGASTGTGNARKKVGLTMFGVTTPCVDKIRTILEKEGKIECYVFHCTGHGGRALENLVEKGELDAVVDLTTTEICDYVAGGVMSAGENRLEAGLKAGIPYIISSGATDMVNFGARDTVPEKYKDRQFLEHNPTVTLMRTNRQETEKVATFIADKIVKFAKGNSRVEVMLPTKGVSMLATEGKPFHSPETDDTFREVLKEKLESAKGAVALQEIDLDINDEQFATKVAKRMVELLKL